LTLQLQKATSRLKNIRKVQPILAALRTISLGSWQMARNRRAGLTTYIAQLLDLLAVVVPHVVDDTRRARFVRLARSDRGTREPKEGERQMSVVALVVGSERGLCGRYNKAILERLDAYVADLAPEWRLTLHAMGSKLIRELTSAGYEVSWTRGTSITALPSYDLAYSLVRDWLRRYEAYELDAVDVVYNGDQGAGKYTAAVMRLIPPELPSPSTTSYESGSADLRRARPKEWVIVETDAIGLYVRIVEQWTATALYRLLLEAAATEHSARYQLMESATQNAEDLIDELMLTVQSARRQAITRQVQELAIGAGLLGREAVKR
jgi:F-type H+-transporting ATPase subunit gamma